MINPLLGSNYKYDPDSGEYINSRHVDLHTKIQEIWPKLRLVWIPKKNRTEEDVTPYCIIDQNDTVIMWFSEADMMRPDLVLARLFDSDLSKHPKGYILNMIETQELAQVLLQEQRQKEEQAERREFAESVLKSPLNKYTAKRNGQKLTFRS